MDKIKVTWNGEKLRDIYPYATKWQVIKFRTRRMARKALYFGKWAVIGLGLLLIAFWLGGAKYSTEVVTFKDREVVVDTLTAKINQLKGALLDDLRSCESGGAPESAGLIVFDSNKQASIGSYQFQIKTIQSYSSSLRGQDLTRKEAILLALDDEEARQLAKEIIFGTDKALENWHNCSIRKGLYNKLETIKLLEK